MSTTCRSCGAPVIWVRSANDKPFILDAEPTRDGRWLVEDGVARYHRPDEDDEGFGYVPHWATCPDAERWHQQLSLLS